MPNLKIEYARHLPSNPKIFAVLSKASDFFGEVEVKEFMVFEDYVNMSKLRVRNYVTILRMLTKVDRSLYDEVKIKLYQIQKLCSYLELNLENVYEKLHNGNPIYEEA